MIRQIQIYVITLSLALLSMPAWNAGTTEYELKAAFIYNFARFIEWPTAVIEEDDKLTLCVVGADPFGPALNALQNREVRGYHIEIRHLNSLPDDSRCGIVFISRSERANLEAIMSRVSQTNGVLSISDVDGFLKHGGVIEFRLVDNKIRFAINTRAAEQVGLNISSRLLQLAVHLE
jgi:hypothetical protein